MFKLVRVVICTIVILMSSSINLFADIGPDISKEQQDYINSITWKEVTYDRNYKSLSEAVKDQIGEWTDDLSMGLKVKTLGGKMLSNADFTYMKENKTLYNIDLYDADCVGDTIPRLDFGYGRNTSHNETLRGFIA